MPLVINNQHPAYEGYSIREQKYKESMYRIALDPQARIQRINTAWHAMDYAEGVFAGDIVTMILEQGIGLISKRMSDPVSYQRLVDHVTWSTTQPDEYGRVVLRTKEGSKSYYKPISIRWSFADFLQKNLVQHIPLPRRREYEV